MGYRVEWYEKAKVKIWDEIGWAYLKFSYRPSLGETEKKHEKPQ
jgi:hypothetical protein